MGRVADRPRGIGRRARDLAVALALPALLCGGVAQADTARLAGNVLSVDPEASSVTILDAGHQHVLTVSPETTIRAGGDDRALTDLHRGDRVVITLADDDASRAARISIAGPAVPQAGRKSLTRSNRSVPSYGSGLNAQSQLR